MTPPLLPLRRHHSNSSRTLRAALPLWLLLSAAAFAERPLTREDAVRLALQRSPSLIAASADAEAARARLGGASLLLQSNPEVFAAAGPRTRQGEASTLELGVGVSQRLELFGQTGARREAAEAELNANAAFLDARRVELAAEVREAFARALAAQQELQVSEDAQALARQGLTAAQERLAAGAATRLEVNSAQVETGRTARDRAHSLQRRATALASLRLLVGLEPGEAIVLADDEAPAPPPRRPALEELQERALKQRSDVLAARAAFEAAQARARLAGREALPSPSLGFAYGREEGAQIFQGTLGMELPLFNRNIAARGEADVRAQQAQRTLEALARQVRAEVEMAVQRLEAAQAALEATSSAVTAALEENLQLANEAYRAGKVDFLQLLLIRREALEARRGSIEVLEELAVAEAQLKRSLGSIE